MPIRIPKTIYLPIVACLASSFWQPTLAAGAESESHPSATTVASHAQDQASDTASQLTIAVDGSGQAKLSAAGAPRGVFVSFQSSAKLTNAVREQLVANGFRLADSADTADITIRLAAAFEFQKPRAKAMAIDFGKVIEDADGNLLSRTEQASYLGVKVELAPVVQGLRGGLSANMVFGAGLVDSMLSLTGTRSWINRNLTGDERGVCVGTAEMCKDWDLFNQSVRLAAFVERDGTKSVIRAQAKASAIQLAPAPLFHAAMRELSGRLLDEARRAVVGDAK